MNSMWKSVVFDSPKRSKIIKKLKYASCENLSDSKAAAVFRGRYTSFVPLLESTLQSPAPATKENKVTFLKKLFESGVTASAEKSNNLSGLHDSGYSLSCPGLDKIDTTKSDSPFQEKSTLFIK